MAQHEVVRGPITELARPSDTQNKKEEFYPQSMQRPASYTGFVPFHKQQSLPTPTQPQPFLSLSLERPDSYSDGNLQRFQQAYEAQYCSEPVCSSEMRTSDVVRRFDLEKQPSQQSETIESSSYAFPSVDVYHGTSYSEAHHSTEMNGTESLRNHTSGCFSSEQADTGLNLRIGTAADGSHDQDTDHKHYPPALANHEDVIQDPNLFMSTVEGLMSALGMRLTIPRLGGKEMNLHLFYCHVTARGGLEQVIRASQWLELAEVLDIPKDIQNVSFVLRKLYTALLFHYEQVYYFRMEGLLQEPPVSLPAPNPVEETADDASPYEILPELKASYKKKKRKLNPMQVFGVDPAASLGSTAPGVINGKFEEGYFVTVVVGTEKLSGVLYHVSSSNNMQQHAGIPSLIDRIGSNGNDPGMEVQLYGCKKRAYVRKTNPDAPKRTRTAYNIFFKEQRAKLERLYPDGKGHGKTVIEMWNKLTDKERAPYIARGSQEREKYLAEHRERLRLQQEQGLVDPHSLGIMQSSEDYNHTGYDGSHDYHVSLDVDDEIYVENVDVPGMDQAYQGYHEGEQVDASTEPAMSHLVPEQAYETCENQGEYPGGRFSDEAKETDDGVEEQYEPGEEHTYPASSNIDEGQGRHEYHVPEPTPEERRHDISQGSDVPEDVYCPQTDNVEVRETDVEGGGVAATKLPFYAQEHAYNYPSVAHQQQMEGVHDSRHMAPYEQMPYQMHENGHVLYPHSQQRQPDAGQDTLVPQHQLFRHNRYGFEQARPGQMGETMGLPVSQDEGSFQRQGDGSPFLASLQQNQAIGSNSHGHQMSTELAYQERYTYPLPLPYPQVYAQPTQAYELRFPHPRYPMQMNEGASSRYGHTYRPQMHHSVTSDPEASGVRPSQVYQQGGAHVSQFQDGSSPSVFKDSTQ